MPHDAHISFEDAESLTNIKHQQVYRWAKGLKDLDAYRKRLYGRAYFRQLTKKKPAKSYFSSSPLSVILTEGATSSREVLVDALIWSARLKSRTYGSL